MAKSPLNNSSRQALDKLPKIQDPQFYEVWMSETIDTPYHLTNTPPNKSESKQARVPRNARFVFEETTRTFKIRGNWAAYNYQEFTQISFEDFENLITTPQKSATETNQPIKGISALAHCSKNLRGSNDDALHTIQAIYHLECLALVFRAEDTAENTSYSWIELEFDELSGLQQWVKSL